MCCLVGFCDLVNTGKNDPMANRMRHTCEVTGVAIAENGKINIRLNAIDGSVPNQWFLAPDQWRKEQLSMALAAMSTGFNVGAELDDPYQEYSPLYVLLLLK